MTDTAEIQTFDGFAYRSDPDQLFENAQPSSALFCRAEAEQWAILTLSRDEG